MYSSAINRPGIMMPIRIRRIESSAMTPSTTAKAEGGIIIARPDDPRIGPSDIGFL